MTNKILGMRRRVSVALCAR